MKFRALDESLVGTAESAKSFLGKRLGVRRFRAEQPVSAESTYTPTLFGETAEHELVAIEVNAGSYTSRLDAFLMDCIEQQLPLRFFIAYPDSADGTAFKEMLKRARRRGVGLLAVDGAKVTQLFGACSLSLFGVRRIDAKRFPIEYRPRLFAAEETFLNGDPVKGCGRVYDLLEAHSRAIAAVVQDAKLLKANAAGVAPKRIRAKTSWATVLETIELHADFTALGTIGLRLQKPLWSRVRGLTPHRNDAGHEPGDAVARQTRDRELRTRFEHAIDTLADLIVTAPGVLAN